MYVKNDITVKKKKKKKKIRTSILSVKPELLNTKCFCTEGKGLNSTIRHANSNWANPIPPPTPQWKLQPDAHHVRWYYHEKSFPCVPMIRNVNKDYWQEHYSSHSLANHWQEHYSSHSLTNCWSSMQLSVLAGSIFSQSLRAGPLSHPLTTALPSPSLLEAVCDVTSQRSKWPQAGMPAQLGLCAN